MSNIFQRLRELIPSPPLLVGKVLAHHADDTSTVELPVGLGLTSYGGNVATGALIRPRGRTVPVGGMAFVRAGVIETEAPAGVPVSLQIGQVVATPPVPVPGLLDFFNGPAATSLLAHTSDSGHAWQDIGFITNPLDVYLDGAGALRAADTDVMVASTWPVPAGGFVAEVECYIGTLAPTVALPTMTLQVALYAKDLQPGGFWGPEVAVQSINGAQLHLYINDAHPSTTVDHLIPTGIPANSTVTLRVELVTGGAYVVKLNGVQHYTSPPLAYPFPQEVLALRLKNGNTGDASSYDTTQLSVRRIQAT